MRRKLLTQVPPTKKALAVIKYARPTLPLREVIENMQADGHGQKASTLAVGVDQSTVFWKVCIGVPRRWIWWRATVLKISRIRWVEGNLQSSSSG